MSLSYKANHIEDVSKTNESLGKDKISKPIMTVYEFDKIIGMRTQQLSSGATPFINGVKKNISSNMELRQVALEELKQGRLPFIIERDLPNKKKEYYRVRDLDLVAIKERIR
uniref:DNA-directed RNA polymerase subunit K n=1 Tax=Virus NIOZ-UU159 TaxID=2763270 RepID=A0A7S9SU97_9VIRU|nr:MAG: DNA-directed RNA polymerase subunit K [Virus NIOZ-UU159]